MDPNQYPNQPQQPQAPLQSSPQPPQPGNFGPTFPPQPNQTPIMYPSPRHRKNKKLPIIIGSAVGLVVVIGVVLAVLLSGDPKKPVTTTPTTHEETSAEGPQPATAIDTEQANNAISQDITSINDDQDLPATQLDDKTLGL